MLPGIYSGSVISPASDCFSFSRTMRLKNCLQIYCFSIIFAKMRERLQVWKNWKQVQGKLPSAFCFAWFRAQAATHTVSIRRLRNQWRLSRRDRSVPPYPQATPLSFLSPRRICAFSCTVPAPSCSFRLPFPAAANTATNAPRRTSANPKRITAWNGGKSFLGFHLSDFILQ